MNKCNDCENIHVECWDCDHFENYVNITNDVDILKDVRKQLIIYKPEPDNSFSGKVADWLVSRVGTMKCFYLLAILTTIPLLFPITMPVIQYISSGYLQLILLPLIIVAGNRTDMIRQQVHDREWKISVINSKIDELIDESLQNIRRGEI